MMTLNSKSPVDMALELFMPQHCYLDLTKDEIIDLAKKFADDPRSCPRFLYVMSHGDTKRANQLVDVNGIAYQEKYILQAFTMQNAPHLKDVLKCIIFNCCRYESLWA